MKINRRRLGTNLQGIALAGHRNLRFIPGRVLTARARYRLVHRVCRYII